MGQGPCARRRQTTPGNAADAPVQQRETGGPFGGTRLVGNTVVREFPVKAAPPGSSRPAPTRGLQGAVFKARWLHTTVAVKRTSLPFLFPLRSHTHHHRHHHHFCLESGKLTVQRAESVMAGCVRRCADRPRRSGARQEERGRPAEGGPAALSAQAPARPPLPRLPLLLAELLRERSATLGLGLDCCHDL